MLIHLLEDEVDIARPLIKYLQNEGYNVYHSNCLTDLSEKIESKIDLHILDWRLPDGEGIEFLKNLRNSGDQTPVIMLTAKADLIDKVVGIELGANDYVTKPFSPRELLARIKRHISVHTKIVKDSTNTLIECGPFLANPKERLICFNGRKLVLKRLEFDLLMHFISNPGSVFSREELLRDVWRFESYPTTRTVDNHILALRKKTDTRHFTTVHGAGYKFQVDVL